MVSNYSPRLSCSRREHWSGSITPPCPLLPPSNTPTAVSPSMQPYLVPPRPNPPSLPLTLCVNLQLPTQSLIMASRRPRNLINTHMHQDKHRPRTHISPEHWGYFHHCHQNLPHHVTFIPSSCADCKLDRSINYLTTHNNPVPFHFILPTAFKHIYVFHPLSLTTSLLLY